MKWWLLAVVAVLLLLPTQIYAEDNLDEQVASLTKRVEVLESYLPQQLLVDGEFTGQGNTRTKPFTIHKTPWLAKWETYMPRKGGTTFTIFVCNPKTGSTVDGYGFQISENITTGQSWFYTPAGTYYLRIDTGGYIQWAVNIGG